MLAVLKNLPKGYAEGMQYDMINQAIRKVPVKKFIDRYESTIKSSARPAPRRRRC